MAGTSSGGRGRRRNLRWYYDRLPFVLVHLSCIAVIWVGWSLGAVLVAIGSYALRAFGITAFYHRGLAHHSFRASRPVMFAGSVMGVAAAQRGPLWWVAHHRQHHAHSDEPGDPHSPHQMSFVRSHVGWIFAPPNQRPDLRRVGDLCRHRELVWLDRFHDVVTTGFIVGLYFWGGWQYVVWGFSISTVALWHATFSVNSVAHRWGRRAYETGDDSRNNWVVSALVLGEGWHNNHHMFPTSARQGLRRAQVDPTWIGLRLLAGVGLVRDLRLPSASKV